MFLTITSDELVLSDTASPVGQERTIPFLPTLAAVVLVLTTRQGIFSTLEAKSV